LTAAVSGVPASRSALPHAGREADGTGLYYYRARYYDSYRHRFVAPDPVGFRGGSVNLFEFVWNAPLDWIDSLGLAVILLSRAGDWPDPAVVEKLGCMSDLLGRDVIVTGGKELAGHVPGSQHPAGLAADVNIPGLSSQEVAARAAQVGFTGIIVYGPPDRRHHTHVDLRPTEFNGYNGRPLLARPSWRTQYGRYDCGSPSVQRQDVQ